MHVSLHLCGIRFQVHYHSKVLENPCFCTGFFFLLFFKAKGLHTKYCLFFHLFIFVLTAHYGIFLRVETLNSIKTIVVSGTSTICVVRK